MTPKQRLRVLYRYLMSGAVDDETFDMAQWPTCAIGEATRIPSLVREGLRLNTDGIPIRNNDLDNDGGVCAVARFFGLEENTADQVFGPDPATAKMVAKRIKRLLEP